MVERIAIVQASVVPAIGTHLREVRVGDVYATRAADSRRRRLFVGVVQRGHTRLRQSGNITLATSASHSTPCPAGT